jgi:hypothetical protein
MADLECLSADQPVTLTVSLENPRDWSVPAMNKVTYKKCI